MQYIFLSYQDKREWDALSADERDALVKACLASNEFLRETGYLIANGSLQDAATIQILKGEISLSGTSLTRTDAQLVELIIISAWDLNEAIRVASKMPQIYRGHVDIWPLK